MRRGRGPEGGVGWGGVHTACAPVVSRRFTRFWRGLRGFGETPTTEHGSGVRQLRGRSLRQQHGGVARSSFRQAARHARRLLPLPALGARTLSTAAR